MKPQLAPKCDPKNDAGARKQGASADNDEAARLRKLDYEAQCYRHAEMIARSRLRQLQTSVEDMVRAEKSARPGKAEKSARVDKSEKAVLVDKTETSARVDNAASDASFSVSGTVP